MYYVIQAYLFDALFSATLVDEDGNQTLRADLIHYKDLLNECHENNINRIIFTGDNLEFINGLAKEVQMLEYRMFNENRIQFQTMKITEVIPE